MHSLNGDSFTICVTGSSCGVTGEYSHRPNIDDLVLL